MSDKEEWKKKDDTERIHLRMKTRRRRRKMRRARKRKIAEGLMNDRGKRKDNKKR